MARIYELKACLGVTSKKQPIDNQEFMGLYIEGVHSRRMGKIGEKIAATIIVTNLGLITSNKYFEHLDGKFFKVYLTQPYF